MSKSGNLTYFTCFLCALLLSGFCVRSLGQNQSDKIATAKPSSRFSSPAFQDSSDSFVATPGNVGSIVFADEFPGSDCGTKINQASKLLDGPGEIRVSEACGAFISTQPKNQTKSPQTIHFLGDYTWRCSVPSTFIDCFNGDGTNGGWNIVGSSRLGTIIKIITPGLNGWGMNCGAGAEHITLDGGGVGLMGIHSGGSKDRRCTNNFINDVQVQNWRVHGLNAGGYPHEWIVINSWFIQNGNDGIYIGANGRRNLVVKNHASSNGGNGIDLGGCSECVATGNEVLENGTLAGGCVMDRVGILLTANSTDIGPAIGTVISRNVTSRNYAGGIFLHAAEGATLSGNLVTENIVQHNNRSRCPPRGGGGIEVLYNRGRMMRVMNNVIAHNTIINNTGYAVYWATSGSVAPIAWGNVSANNAAKNNSMGNFISDNYTHVTNTDRR